MPKILRPVAMNKCLGCFTCMNICSVINQKNHSINKSAIKVRTTGGMTSSFIAIVCLGCREPACLEVCPSNALQLHRHGNGGHDNDDQANDGHSNGGGNGVRLNADKCIGCRKCEAVCIMRAINFDSETKKPIICRHCGICARFCPHNCLQLVEAEEAAAYA